LTGKWVREVGGSESHTENGKAFGVEYKRKKPDSNVTRVMADYIIANTAIPNVANELLPNEEANKLKKRIENLRYSPSLLNVYIGFNKPLRQYGVKHYSTVVCDNSCRSMADIYRNFIGDFSKRNFFFVDYGQLDSKLAPEGKTVGSICTSDYLSHWEHLTDEEYKAKKENVARTLFERLNRIYPGIKDAIDNYEIGTAKTIKRYIKNPGGSVYGFAQIPSQSRKNRLSQKSPIENLYFASAWTEPRGGFGATLGGGYMLANKILNRD
jgi:phytoene dehydrogenase-like protein